MPQINQPLLYVYKNRPTLNTHASSLALHYDILGTSVRSTAPNSNCSLPDSIKFLLQGIGRGWHIRTNQTFYLLKTHQIYLEPHYIL